MSIFNNIPDQSTIIVDIDNTICRTKGASYKHSEPIIDRVDYINKLYKSGHRIIYYSARGTTTGIDWLELTKEQLEKWGCKYHELHLGKPYYDYQIDDKTINSELFFPLFSQSNSKEISFSTKLKEELRQNILLNQDFMSSSYSEVVDNLYNDTINCLGAGKKLILAGNGGSFADASHFSAELIAGYSIKEKPPIPCHLLGSNNSLLTACSNDFDYSNCFIRELESVYLSGDIVYLLSTSGESSNILKLANHCKEKDICSWAIGSRKNSKLSLLLKETSLSFSPSLTTPQIQYLTYQLLHSLAERLETDLS